MRSLITATVVATVLLACGQQNSQSGSSLADASDDSGAPAAYASALNWSVSYEGATSSGTLQLDSNGVATVSVTGMPTGQAGSMDVVVMNGTQVVYRATLSDLTVGQAGLVRRVSLAAASSYSADDSAQYCGNEFFQSNDNNDNQNFNSNSNSNFNPNSFGNEFGNSQFNNGFNQVTATPVGTSTGATPVTPVSTGGGVAPKAGNGSLQLIMVVPR